MTPAAADGEKHKRVKNTNVMQKDAKLEMDVVAAVYMGVFSAIKCESSPCDCVEEEKIVQGAAAGATYVSQ